MRCKLLRDGHRQARVGAIILAAASLVASCTVGPDYQGPPDAAPLATFSGLFHRAPIAPVVATTPADKWWLTLNDPELNKLILLAFDASPNVKAARAKLRSARAMLGEERTHLLPRGGASAAYLHAKIPTGATSLLGTGQGSAASGGSSAMAGASSSITTDLYSAGFDATWELDIFGGVRRGIENARAKAEAQAASLEDAQVQLAADMAKAYFNLRDAQLRADLGMSDVACQDKMIQLTLQRRSSGTASDIEVQRLRVQAGQTRADIINLQAMIDQYLDQIAFLAGHEPGTLDAELVANHTLPTLPQVIPIGNPAAMIRRRPDIRQAERQLAAANAVIGQDIAKYFPTVSFFGTVGFASTDISTLLKSSNMSVIGAPSISWNILNFPQIGAQVRGAKADRDEAIANYEKTVLSALQDAEDSLSQFGHQRDNVYELSVTHEAATRAAAATRNRYSHGTASLIDYLDTERQRLSAEQNLIQSKAKLTVDFASLQKSLGLGWNPATPQSTGLQAGNPVTTRAREIDETGHAPP